MESGNGASSSTGHFYPVPVISDDFNSILAQLQHAYLFDESKYSFKYTSAFLTRNPVLEEKYKSCREKRRQQGYKEEDLEESFGFLLFDDLDKAKSIGETGALTGNGTCTTLGDPKKGVYLSMYSDCLDLNRWYHGKSGYILIFRLTQGRVKMVSENYTQNLTEPTEGFDCHLSEQLSSVSSKTSSFLAFGRTQYYLYELLDNGSTAQSPSLACPYAIIAFSYTDAKEAQHSQSSKTKVSCPFSPWMGTLQLGSQTFNVEMRSKAGALTLAKLPPVINAERAITMMNLRRLLPKAIFGTTLEKVQQANINCNLCEVVALSSEQDKWTPLLLELKEKSVALVITIREGGFLFLIHGSHFIVHYKDNGITTNQVLQGVFVFPQSHTIQRVAKIEQMTCCLPSDALHVLPLLTYAEEEIEKTSLESNEDLCEIFVQYMQTYASLMCPSSSSSPLRDVSSFPDQYDVPDAHGHLYLTPEWTNKQWQCLTTYLNNAQSFQLPVNKASEVFAAGQNVRQEDLDDDFYLCLSSPDELSTNSMSVRSEDRPDEECSTNVEISQNTTTPPFSTVSKMVPKVQTQETIISQTTSLIPSPENNHKSLNRPELPVRTEEPSEELIVCITSAAHAVGVEGLDVMTNDTLSVTTNLEKATLNFSEIVQNKLTLNCSNDSKVATDTDRLPLGPKVESAQSPSLQIVKTLLGQDNSSIDHVTQELEKNCDASEAQENEQGNDKSSNTTQVSEQPVVTIFTNNALLKELETCTLKKKSERWGLKPVISTCGSIFIPFGSVGTEHMKSLQDKFGLSKNKMHQEDGHPDASSETSDALRIQQKNNDKQTTESSSDEHDVKCMKRTKSDKHLMTTSNTKNHLEENTDIPSAGKLKSEKMLTRLKSVILKKRSNDILKIGLSATEDQENEPSPKQTKIGLSSEKSSPDVCVKETNVDDQSLSKLPSVDPIFAHALGLTPKESLDINAVQRSDVSLKKEFTCSKQRAQSSPKGFGSRLKMLKKSQSVTAGQVKKKWWLHFQTPTCIAEKKYEISSRENSIVRRTVKEKTDTSSEALNLLADLALIATKEQVSPRPTQAGLQELGSSLKKCEITKDVSNSEQQSDLHELLRQPPSIQPQESPSPAFVGGSELVDVICQEHSYSLPSFPSLLLALPAPFQVSPLNGLSRLRHTQSLSEGVDAKHPAFSPEQKFESKREHPGDSKRSWFRRKFRLLRTVVDKEKSFQVTRHWEEVYDFNRDSRFTVDPKDKSIVRALHGPWDFSIHDTKEEVQLIVHMWIGLFYSRSTARFFHLDSDKPMSSSNEDRHMQSVSETALNSSLTNSTTHSEPKILDLSKPKHCVVDKEPVILNLSPSRSGVESAHQNTELKDPTQSPMSFHHLQGLQASLPFQWRWNLVHPSGNLTPLQYVGVPVDKNYGMSSKLNHQLFIPVWDGIAPTNIWANNIPTQVLPTVECQSKNARAHIPKSLESPIRKRGRPRRAPKDTSSTSVPRNIKKRCVKDNLPNVNTSADLNSATVDKGRISSKTILEIKNTYMEKLASINQNESISTSQTDKDGRDCNLLKKLLLEKTIIPTPENQQPLECKAISCQIPQLNASPPRDAVLNQNVDQQQHVSSLPTSVVTESCTNAGNANKSLNRDAFAPSVEADHSKSSSAVDSDCVSSIKEKDGPLGQCTAMGSVANCINQDMNTSTQDASDDTAMDCSLSPVVKTCEVPSFDKVNLRNNFSTEEAEHHSGSVEIPFIGMDMPIDDMLKEKTSSEMNEEKASEDMEIVESESSSAHNEVTPPPANYKDDTSNNPPCTIKEKSVDENEVNHLLDIGECAGDDPCLTLTPDKKPYVCSQTIMNCGDDEKVSQDNTETELEIGSTPVLDEASVEDQKPKSVICDVVKRTDPQANVELQSLRTLQCFEGNLSSFPQKSSRRLFKSKHTPNTVITPNKKSSALICKSKYSSTTSTHFPPLSVLDNIQQSKKSFPMTDMELKHISSTETTRHTIFNKSESSTLNTSCSTSHCTDVAEIPRKRHKGQMDCKDSVKPLKFLIKRTKQGSFFCCESIFDTHHQNQNSIDDFVPSNFTQPVEDVQDVKSPQCMERVSPLPTQTIISVKTTPRHVTAKVKNPNTTKDLLSSMSFVDGKTITITDERRGLEGSFTCAVTKRMGPSLLSSSLLSQRCLQNDQTQSPADQECLICFDKMKLLFKRSNPRLQIHCEQSSPFYSSPIIVQFSNLKERREIFDENLTPYFNLKRSLDMSDREHSRSIEEPSTSKPSSQGEIERPGVSAVAAECLYKDILDKVSFGNRSASLFTDLQKTNCGDSTTDSCIDLDCCSEMQREMDDSLCNRLKSGEKKSNKTKSRFFLFITSDDLFFNDTREHLESEGHVAVEPSDFFLSESSSSLLLVIIRNEDIAEHIFKVPHLLPLRKSPVVQFAGIDEPDDVVNLTYQEIFVKGGFVMFDRTAAESLSHDNTREIVEILQGLMQTGKWKWVMHYRDRRRIRENARSCPDAKEKNNLLSQFKEDGFLDILPYHECDHMSRDQPNYLQCLCQQQVQNISARYPVFVTDSHTDQEFEKNGIIVMTINSFLMDSLSTIKSFT